MDLIDRRRLAAFAFAIAVAFLPTAAQAADVAISGTAWRLSSIGGEDAAAGVMSTLTFNDDNNISGNGGCNSFGGKASFDGAKLKIADVFSTMMACEQPKMEQEAAFLAALAKAASYTVEGGTLTLLDGSGTAVATLTAP